MALEHRKVTKASDTAENTGSGHLIASHMASYGVRRAAIPICHIGIYPNLT